MCLAVFIAADHALPLVAQTSPPSFSIEELAERSLAISDHFPGGWCVRYAGSTTGCGCDFRGTDSAPSRAALRDYLATLPRSAQVRIHVCWDGDESEPLVEQVSATADDLAASDEAFGEGVLITLVPC